MGYHTYFTGRLKIVRRMSDDDLAELKRLMSTTTEMRSDPCPWETDGNGLYIYGVKKAYQWEHWLTFLIDHFFDPKKVILDGLMRYQGEDFKDRGCLLVRYEGGRHSADLIPDAYENPLETEAAS